MSFRDQSEFSSKIEFIYFSVQSRETSCYFRLGDTVLSWEQCLSYSLTQTCYGENVEITWRRSRNSQDSVFLKTYRGNFVIVKVLHVIAGFLYNFLSKNIIINHSILLTLTLQSIYSPIPTISTKLNGNTIETLLEYLNTSNLSIPSPIPTISTKLIGNNIETLLEYMKLYKWRWVSYHSMWSCIS